MKKISRLVENLRSLKRALFPKKTTHSQHVEASPQKIVPTNKIWKDEVKTIECLYGKYCSGCGACANLCPNSAIRLKPNDDGFLQPVINKTQCTECGSCKNLCPAINAVYKNTDKPECFAAYACDDVRKGSSSGGIFPVIANYIFDQGGFVCGAAYDENFTVKHRIISDRKDLHLLQKSKYVQSDVGLTFKEIKSLLEKNQFVLFCGCGCQVAGLYAALEHKQFDKLYTIDLICRGVSSPKLFHDYLKTHYDLDNLSFIGFREKEPFGWSHGGIVTRTKDGKESRISRTHDPFYKAFLAGIPLGECCENCLFSKLPRQGDITLGDFWGIERRNRNFSDGKGTSLVSVNSSKGDFLFGKIRENLLLCEEVPLEYVLSTGKPFQHPFKVSPNRKHYFELIRSGASVEKALDYAVKRKYDVGVFGVWYGSNYGSTVTYYALHEILRSLGLTVLMIDKIRLKNDPEANPNSHPRIFARKHLYNVSESYPLHELQKLNNYVDTFILGSDQVFCRRVNRYAGYSFYFDFVDETKKKIAFAASFGHDRDFSNDSESMAIKNYLKRFDGIGVRESSAVTICNGNFGVSATRVLDPVFVANRKIFDELVEGTTLYKKRDSEESFFTAYILDPTPAKREAVLHVEKKLGIRPIIILDRGSPHLENDKKVMDMDENIVSANGIEEWLSYFKCAEFVLTDSCHGLSFSIIFDKPFIAIGNPGRGIARFESLVNLFKLHAHYVRDASEIMLNDYLFAPVDYDAVHKILCAERERSLNWLKERLFGPKVISSCCVYPVIDRRLLGSKSISKD